MGPTLPISKEIHAMKHRSEGESFKMAIGRQAQALSDSQEHFSLLQAILRRMDFLMAGRIQAAAGSPTNVTAFNCFVSGLIKDSLKSIMDRAGEAAQTMKMGGGIGYGFSKIRPRNDMIVSLASHASGPVSFMRIFDAVCGTIASAGHRRGAQMATLLVSHPDIEEFITCKQNETDFKNFNISVLVTDEFMRCVKTKSKFPLEFNGRIYKYVDANALWDKIMRATWDWAEPGVLFIDKINRKNNLWYCETIDATNPCGEQPLPVHGACLLGSFNLVNYIKELPPYGRYFDYDRFINDIPVIVRAMDNVIDSTSYPLPEQEAEAKSKRRMGIGVTGVANAMEALGHPYGTKGCIDTMKKILRVLRDGCYAASARLAAEKGSFLMYDEEQYLQGEFIQTLPEYIQDLIRKHGIRNSHLLSIAPTGTISLTADNVSSGVEPVFSKEYTRTIQTHAGVRYETVKDYGYRVWGVDPKTADAVSPMEHVAMLNAASEFVDSAVSKTCNIGADVTWDEFKNVYMSAYDGGASGCTTFRASGKRFGILNASAVEDVAEGAACTYDPETGIRTCDE